LEFRGSVEQITDNIQEGIVSIVVKIKIYEGKSQKRRSRAFKQVEKQLKGKTVAIFPLE